MSGRMAARGESLRPSGPGQAKLLAEKTALGLATGEVITMAVKRATLEQLSGILTYACAKGGFPAVNRHLYIDELAGLGWMDLHPLHNDPVKGEEALEASVATLEHFGAPVQQIAEYRAIFRQALDGHAFDMLRQARITGHVPRYIAFEKVKVPVPEGRKREPKILVFCFLRTVVFPAAPVFHAQPVSNPQSQYGALNVTPGSIFPGLFGPELASTKNLKLHVVGAVYGAKLAWAMAHDGQEPPAQVVDAWGPLQSSHLLEGPIGLRRNFNPRFLTLESEWDNKLRHGCAAALLKKLASGMLPADAGALLGGHLVESQTTGSQPQEGDFSLVEGNNILLSEMFNEEDEIERFCQDINDDICSKLHQHAPCKFWNKSYGAVPDAISIMPINDNILFEKLLAWPPELESGAPSGEPPAKRVLVAFDWAVPKTVSQAKEKMLFIERETEIATTLINERKESRTAHPTLNRLRVKKSQCKKTIARLQTKEDAAGAAEENP
ncbi:hypothetical protein COCOBI_07-6800 [Coccomyxa sp. Obi]|nr:hypothetical protein COCOBI_07-6800 [Coccomyxa sp. Obi]